MKELEFIRDSLGSISTQFQDRPHVEPYKASDIFNENARLQELNEVLKELKGRGDNLESLLDVFYMAQIRTSSPKEARDYRSWLEAQERSWSVFNYLATLDEPYNTRVARARAGTEPLTIREYCRNEVLHIGGELIIKDNIKQGLFYATQHGLANSFRSYAELQEFCLGVSRENIKINGVSLGEALDMDQRKDGFAAQFRLLMDATLIIHRRSHESVFMANQEGLFRRYPNITKYTIERSIGAIRAGLISTPDIVDSDIKNNSGVGREVAQRGKHYVERIKHIVEGAYNNILNPNSAEFTSLQEAVTFYLSQEEFEKLNVLYILGLDRYNHIYQMYRVAKAFKEQGIQSSFYELLADSVMEYTHRFTDGVILHEEDTDEILEPEQIVNQSLIAVPSFGTIISSIFSKGSQRVFDNIDPSVVDSTGLSRPQAITTTFDQNRPQKFTVSLHWENELGESTDIRLGFDTKRDQFDWNFLKLPTDPDMRFMNVAALTATQAILASVKAGVLREYQQKRQNTNTQVILQGTGAKQKKERVVDEVYAVRKQIRQEARSSVTAVRIDLSEAIESITIPRRIELSETEKLQGMLENIHFGERGDVLKAIERFNQEGVGEFTRKRAKSQTGEILYSLRVGNKRVLVYETESSVGIRNFKIIDIDYRSKVYRKNKI